MKETIENLKKVVAIVLLGIIISSCAGPTMHVDNIATAKLNPMGLFICASTQMIDEMTETHRKFIVDIATQTLTEMFKGQYKIKPLNDRIRHDDGFKKFPSSFYINEEKIAQIAKQEGCSSCLIVYYSSTDFHVAIMAAPAMNLPITGQPINAKDLHLYYYGSLYGWLVSTDNASLISKSHTGLTPFNEYINGETTREQLSRDYAAYIKTITIEMFRPMITENK